jgi:hypothetical protein
MLKFKSLMLDLPRKAQIPVEPRPSANMNGRHQAGISGNRRGLVDLDMLSAPKILVNLHWNLVSSKHKELWR